MEKMRVRKVEPAERFARLDEASLADASDAAEKQDTRPQPPADDRTLFLRSLGELDVRFADAWPEEPPEQIAVPRRMKLVRQGRLLPEAEVDLHGLGRDEALERVRAFLRDAVQQGLRTVLIVTGRGKHSAGRALLRQQTEAYLRQGGRAWVSEWGRAPGRYGGLGALVVFLKAAKTTSETEGE